MSEVAKYSAQKKKLEGLCEEHDFTYSIKKTVYPITLTIRPIQGVEEQLSMLEEADGSDYISPDASLTWIFADNDVTSKVEGGTFTMPKSLESKFVNIFKKMVSFWQQYFFKFLVEGNLLTNLTMPVIDEADATDEDEEPEDDEEVEPEDEDLEADDDDEPKADPEVDAELGKVIDFPGEASSDEDLITQAKQLVRFENKASMQLLARRLRIGYAKASQVMTALKDAGVVAFNETTGKWEVLPADAPEEG